MDLPRTPAPPPVVAGRYRVGRLLGRGGMADVYAAVDERTGDEVAVKLFRDPAGHDPERSVADEARTLARLRHPGLVALLDAGEDDGWPYCVMTLVTARRSRSAWRTDRWTPPRPLGSGLRSRRLWRTCTRRAWCTAT